MRTSSRILLVVACILAGVDLPSFAASAPKVEETVLGPTDIGGIFAVSPTGAHVAYVGTKGTKLFVAVDGVAGPEFDELFLPHMGRYTAPTNAGVHAASRGGLTQIPGVPVVFSDTGAHHAYVGRQGENYVVIHDDKEIGRGPVKSLNLGNGPLTISPGGRQVIWAESDQSQPRTTVRLLISGKPGPWFQPVQGLTTPVISPDDSRHAYVLPNTLGSNKQVLIVDGKDAGYFGGQPVFTADSGTLLTVSNVGGATLLANGKPALPPGVQITKVVVAPVGKRYAAIIRLMTQGNKAVDVLYVDGEQVPGSQHAQDVWFSPNGKRYAAVCRNAFGGTPTMVIDGDAYPFTRIDPQPPYWTADSSKMIFTGATAEGEFLVVEDDMYPHTRPLMAIVVAEEGDRFAWGTIGAGADGHSIVIGNKAVLPAGVYPVSKFMFSADGSRFGFLTARVGRSDASGILIDGVILPGILPGNFVTWFTNSSTALSPFAFSRDGKHVAHIGVPSGARAFSMFVDGQAAHRDSGTVYYPTFTPDSKHLFWIAAEPGSRPEAMSVVHLDGQPVARGNAHFFKEMKNTFTVDKDGVATFLAVDGNTAKRYRITPSPDTSVATMLAANADATVAAAVAPATPPPSAATKPATAAVTPPPAPPAAKPTQTTAPATASATVAKSPTTPPAPAVPFVPLTWNDLVRRPETRPATCAVNKDYNFQGGVTVRAGTMVNIIEFKPGDLLVGTPDGRTNFNVKPAECDVLDAANAAWATLTPAQRSLTYPSLLKRMDLWPYRVKLSVPVQLEGRSLRIGDPVLLQNVEGNDLLVRIEGTLIAFNMEPQQTDLMAQARGFLADNRGAPGRVMEEFAGKVSNPLDGRPITLDPNARPGLVVMYMGAAWCGPCQVFSPKLTKLIRDKAPKPSDVAFFYLSGDKTPAEMKAYVTKMGIAWPTIRYSSTAQLPAFAPFFGNVIPQLVVTDRHGKLLVDSNQIGYDRALAQLGTLLE
jgi:thiol-disulfide isomerase/thioredoxin